VGEAYARIDNVDDQPVDIGRRLIVRGWLPAKHVPVVARKHYILPTKADAKPRSKKKGAKDPKDIDTHETVLRWMSTVDRQDHDPVTVRIVRLLRAIGYDREKIRVFLRNYFAFGSVIRAKQVKKVSAIEQQIAKQQAIIDMLAAQLQALRSGNRTINEYHQMVAEVGVNLLRNAELISSTEADGGKTSQKTTNRFDYEKLREAVIAFLDADPEATDAFLIETLDAHRGISEEEETPEEILADDRPHREISEEREVRDEISAEDEPNGEISRDSEVRDGISEEEDAGREISEEEEAGREISEEAESHEEISKRAEAPGVISEEEELSE
jgi:hypothetical protein